MISSMVGRKDKDRVGIIGVVVSCSPCHGSTLKRVKRSSQNTARCRPWAVH